jgi:hypothetical protein
MYRERSVGATVLHWIIGRETASGVSSAGCTSFRQKRLHVLQTWAK